MLEMDTILLCTGYHYTFPFLSPECGVNVSEDERVTPLWKHLTHTRSMFKDKEKIKEAGKREKPAGLFVSDDLTKSVRTIRGKLKDKMKAAREAGHRAYL